MAFSGNKWGTIPDQSSLMATAKKIVWLSYLLYAAGLISGITAIVAIVLDYIKRDDVRGTWLESHFTWQIRTFWWSLLWMGLGLLTSVVFIGIPIMFAATVWFIYRLVKGMLYLYDQRSLPMRP